MANVKLKYAGQMLLQGQAVNISPLGFECEIALEAIASLRDDSGRFRQLDLELSLLAHAGQQQVSGTVNVYSVRRVSQQSAMLMLRFGQLEQDAYRLLAEHLSPARVVSLQQARNKKRA